MQRSQCQRTIEEGKRGGMLCCTFQRADCRNLYSFHPAQASISADGVTGQIVMAPFNYLMERPGKNFRRQVLAAFNVWLQVDEVSFNIVDRVIGMLHNASLLSVNWLRPPSALHTCPVQTD